MSLLLTCGPALYIVGVVSNVIQGLPVTFTFTVYGAQGDTTIELVAENLPDDPAENWTFTDNADRTATLTADAANTVGRYTFVVRARDATRQGVTKKFRFEVVENSQDGLITLLLNMQGANLSQDFVDSSIYEHTVTAEGNVYIGESLGYKAAIFEDPDDYLNVPADDLFDIEDGPMTIEVWARITTFTDFKGLISRMGGTIGSSPKGWGLWVASDRVVTFTAHTAASATAVVITFGAMTSNVMHHIVVQRYESGDWVGFIDGDLGIAGSVFPVGAIDDSGRDIKIGRLGIAGNDISGGAVRAVRITRAVRYTGPFTPPVPPLPVPEQ